MCGDWTEYVRRLGVAEPANPRYGAIEATERSEAERWRRYTSIPLPHYSVRVSVPGARDCWLWFKGFEDGAGETDPRFRLNRSDALRLDWYTALRVSGLLIDQAQWHNACLGLRNIRPGRPGRIGIVRRYDKEPYPWTLAHGHAPPPRRQQ